MGKTKVVVCFERMTKVKKHTTKPLTCVFLSNARQRPHDSVLHGKGPLSCAFVTCTTKDLCRASKTEHSKKLVTTRLTKLAVHQPVHQRLTCASLWDAQQTKQEKEKTNTTGARHCQATTVSAAGSGLLTSVTGAGEEGSSTTPQE
jgi:hypothetical protein